MCFCKTEQHLQPLEQLSRACWKLCLASAVLPWCGQLIWGWLGTKKAWSVSHWCIYHGGVTAWSALGCFAACGIGVTLPAESWLFLKSCVWLKAGISLSPVWFLPSKLVDVTLVCQEKTSSACCVLVWLISERMLLTKRNNPLSRKWNGKFVYKSCWVIRNSQESLESDRECGLVGQPLSAWGCWMQQLLECWAFPWGEQCVGQTPFWAGVRIWENQKWCRVHSQALLGWLCPFFRESHIHSLLHSQKGFGSLFCGLGGCSGFLWELQGWTAMMWLQALRNWAQSSGCLLLPCKCCRLGCTAFTPAIKAGL